MGWHTQAPSILIWAVGIDANGEVDAVDEDPEEGYSHPIGYGNVENTTNVGDVRRTLWTRNMRKEPNAAC